MDAQTIFCGLQKLATPNHEFRISLKLVLVTYISVNYLRTALRTLFASIVALTIIPCNMSAFNGFRLHVC